VPQRLAAPPGSSTLFFRSTAVVELGP
jgi:hypothetical protein